LLHADLIISFGMRFDDRVTGNLATFGVDADVIHVEIDPSEIDKNVRASVAINADTAEALKMLIKDPGLISKPRQRWLARVDDWREEIRAETQSEVEAGVGREGRLLMKTITHKLSKITAGKDLVVGDVGQHQMILARYYNYQTTNSWFTSGGAGTMGCSLPMAVGVKLVRPDERVWSVSGDGGFQMNIQELGTIMEYGIDIKILLFNNDYLGMVRQWQTLFYDGRYAGTPMMNPDYGMIAGAYGIPYRKVSKVEEIDDALQTAADYRGAYMVEFVCDATEIVLPMVPAGGGFADMITAIKKG